jgi:hypothetical protein
MAHIFRALGHIFRLQERNIVVWMGESKTVFQIPSNDKLGRLLEVQREEGQIVLLFENEADPKNCSESIKDAIMKRTE